MQFTAACKRQESTDFGACEYVDYATTAMIYTFCVLLQLSLSLSAMKQLECHRKTKLITLIVTRKYSDQVCF